MMRNLPFVFLLGCLCTIPLYGDSLLKAQSFPKTFDDLSFTSKIELLRDGYKPFEVQYDENGVCISGCAYKGITIKEDMQAVDEATEQMANLIAEANTQTANNNVPVQPAQPTPTEPVVQPSKPTATNTAGNYAPTQGSDWCRNGLSSKLPLRYPVDMTNFKHVITSDFGFRKIKESKSNFHPAIDIGCPVGTPVYATADGIVEATGFDKGGGGNYVNIKHESGFITQYLHLSKIEVSQGQTINACQKIALSGNTGSSSGPHLDYRIRFQGDRNRYVDILCPLKSSDRKTHQSYNTDTQNMNSEHSLFFNKYKFSRYNSNSNETKRSLWRVEHGHCMNKNTDLLPDEVR